MALPANHLPHRWCTTATMSGELGEESGLPPERCVPFGAGLNRKHVHFVPAKVPNFEQATVSSIQSTTAGDTYLSIVLKNTGSSSTSNSSAAVNDADISTETLLRVSDDTESCLCEICNLPIGSVTSKQHEASIAHMICLEHSHPPSHLDRNRQGLKYLSSYGWDPDSRLGLGAAGEGIRAPIKVKVKHDTVGLGVDLEGLKKAPGKKLKPLNAKQARKKYTDDRKKMARLQEMFYRNDGVEKYLGSG